MLTVDIKKSFPGFNLDVSFETEREIMGLLGASGCGKSMTLKCIAGIEKPDEGRIVLDGRVLFDSAAKIDLPPQQRRVGYLFQQYALFPNMTVEQNIAAGCREKDAAKKAERVAEKIREMRINGLEKKHPRQLSGGEQQRVALARILINEPELLLLDEPFSALDSYLKWQLELEVADRIEEFGKGALLVSHSRDEVCRLCDSVCILDNGKSEKKMQVNALFEAPETLAACLLSGCKNFSRIELIDKCHVNAVDWGISLTLSGDSPEGAELVGIRAHYVGISEKPTGENSLTCSVERVLDNVFSTIVMVSPGEGKTPIRIEGDKNLAALRVGQQVYVSLPAERLMPLRG